VKWWAISALIWIAGGLVLAITLYVIRLLCVVANLADSGQLTSDWGCAVDI